MRRRRFLATVGRGSAFLAGCTTLSESRTDGRSSPRASDDPDADTNGVSDIELSRDEPTVVDFETAPLTATVSSGRVRTDDGLSMVLEFIEPATADRPATLAAVVENNRSYDQTFESRRLPALDNPAASRSESDANDSIYLAPTDDHPLAEREPNYDRDEDGRWRLEDVGDDSYPETVAIEAEERIAGEHYLLGHHLPDAEPIEAGRNEFSQYGGAFEVVLRSTDEPGPDGDSKFTGAESPPLPNEEDVRWYHDATPETPVFLEPNRESVAAPARIAFDFVNHGRERLSGNPYWWRLYKLADDEWFPIAPWGWPMPLSTVDPGSVEETELFLYDGAPVTRPGERTVGHLGGGRYAYTVGYSSETETYAAQFDLEVPNLEVGPETDAAVVEEGETVVVRLPNYEEARRPATFTATRFDSPAKTDVDERLVPEQLPRRPFHGFRNSLPLFEDEVETVEIQTDRNTALRLFDFEENVTKTVAFDGSPFEATGSLSRSDRRRRPEAALSRRPRSRRRHSTGTCPGSRVRGSSRC